jgi:hypothetical protein
MEYDYRYIAFQSSLCGCYLFMETAVI